ncbi:Cutinase transcription factor 1 beta [Zalerion maritima]|uniref:Cutinase transcription factor 1 beta n=1 Tax=Zalerion maritima TaxID=339359 RepID=A0AAD5RWC7_9PEZI|nr:Cutinase transcription factor 1 beta [Zalerion maritima]
MLASRVASGSANRVVVSALQTLPSDGGYGMDVGTVDSQGGGHCELLPVKRPSSESQTPTAHDATRRVRSRTSSEDRSTSYDRHVQADSLPGVQWIQYRIAGSSQYVPYSHYRFLSTRAISSLPPQDFQFLQDQGSLSLPGRPILNDFVWQYFLHVHPMLPIFDEAEFWDLYSNNAASNKPRDRISLLVFQAMLFSCCNFVSPCHLKALGLSTTRIARAAFYRRAKLLLDLESESSPIAISQAALLLSSWTLSSSAILRNPRTPWLYIAIQHAEIAGAHRYGSLGPTSEKYGVLKRLWWCCVIRDCIFGMGTRRGIQITSSQFDFRNNSVLGYTDLSGETEHSMVHDPDTKRQLAGILEQLVELCIVLTDILALVFPLEESPGWRAVHANDQEKVRRYKMALRRWHRSAVSRLAAFKAQPALSEPESQHGTVILYTRLLFMYYYSARAALCHHEILQLAAAAMAFSAGSPQPLVFEDNRQELHDAASGTTECLKDLLRLDLARWLPISAVTCTALPLFLYVLDIRVLSLSRAPEVSQLEIKQDRLNVLVEAMKTYQPQYDSVDWITKTISQVIRLARLECDQSGGGGSEDSNSRNSRGEMGASMADWTDILSFRPGWYVRLALTMDLTLSKGRLPEDRDFPVGLRDFLASGIKQYQPPQERGPEESKDFDDENQDYVAAAAAAAGIDAGGVAIEQTPERVHHPVTTTAWEFEETGQMGVEAPQGCSKAEGEAMSQLKSDCGLQRELWQEDLPFATDDPVEGFGGLPADVFDMLAACYSSPTTDIGRHAGSFESADHRGLMEDGLVDELGWSEG